MHHPNRRSPVVSIGGGWRWSPNNGPWRLSADVGYFQADINDIDADVTTGRVGVEWFPHENWGLWTDYNVRRIGADTRSDRLTGNLRFVDQGLRLGGTYRF